MRPVPWIDRVHRDGDPPAEEQTILRLSRNERVGELPAWFVERLRDLVTSSFVTRYPYGGRLKGKLAAGLGVQPDQILLTPGSDAAIKALFHAFVAPGERVVSLEPSYAMYTVYAEMFQAHHARVPFDSSMGLDERALIDAVSAGTRLVLIANPNQPTGTLLSTSMLDALARRAAQVGALLAIDEAYFPFGAGDAPSLAAKHHNVVAIRTFSKAAGLASARVGYITGAAHVIGALAKVRTVHDINSFAIAAAEIVVDHPELMHDYAAAVEEGRRLVEARVRAWDFDPLPSATNFMLIRVAPNADPAAIIRGVYEHGILIKGPFREPCLDGCVRVTLGPPDVMARFCDALDEVMRQSASTGGA